MTTRKETKPSAPSQVNKYLKALKHPLSNVVQALRQIILKTDPTIGEEIKWNAPAFFFTGEMEPSNPKLYQRYLVVFNVHRKDCIRLIFWRGARVKDTFGLLEGDYSDGRRLAMFDSIDDVKAKGPALRNVVKQQLNVLRK